MTFDATITDKPSHQSHAENQAEIRLTAPSMVALRLARSAGEPIERHASTMAPTTRSGEQLGVHSFSVAPERRDHTLGPEVDGLLLAIQRGNATPTPIEISDIERLLDGRQACGKLPPSAVGAVALLVDGGHATAAGSGPAALSLSLTSQTDGTVTASGIAVAATPVRAVFPDSTSLTVTANPRGHCGATPTTAQPSSAVVSADALNAQRLSSDVSNAACIHATPAATPSVCQLIVATDGLSVVRGLAEPGSTATGTFPDGRAGSPTAGPDRSYSANSSINQPTGTVSATATDVSGHTGPAATAGFTDPNSTPATSTWHDEACGGAGKNTSPLAGLNLTRVDGGQGSTSANVLLERILDASQRSQNTEEQLLLTTRSGEFDQKPYKLASRTVLDLLDTEAGIVASVIDSINARHDRWQATVAFLIATGQSRTTWALDQAQVVHAPEVANLD